MHSDFALALGSAVSLVRAGHGASVHILTPGFPFAASGVIAVVMFFLLCLAAIAVRLYQQRNLYTPKEAPPESHGTNEAVLRRELSVQNAARGTQKEHFV